MLITSSLKKWKSGRFASKLKPVSSFRHFTFSEIFPPQEKSSITKEPSRRKLSRRVLPFFIIHPLTTH